MGRDCKNVVLYLLNLFLFFSLAGNGLSQPAAKEGPVPRVRLENVAFHVREIESTPSLIRILEIHVEIFNPSQRQSIPPNSIRAVVIPKKVKHSGEKPSDEFVPPAGEIILNLPLPPRTERTLAIGFSIPEYKLGSITFEVQLNPPKGETKVVTWEEK